MLRGLDLRGARRAARWRWSVPSGSGKSTVSLLLPRFYDPQQRRRPGRRRRRARAGDDRAARRGRGGVRGGVPLLRLDRAPTSRYGRPDATDAEIRGRPRGAEAAEFIEALPDGYDTVIGERGLTLSGGQRQRLALARALLTDPRVLVLDDATSAVDPITEAAIHGTLRRVTADRTTILIAHRRSTLALADRIAVVVDGRVADVGTHDELVARSAAYRDLLGTELAPDPAAPDIAAAPGAGSDRRSPGRIAHGRRDRTASRRALARRRRVRRRPNADRLAGTAADRIGGPRARRTAAAWGRAASSAPPRRPRAAGAGRRPAAGDGGPAETAARTPVAFSLARTLRPVRWLLALALLLVAWTRIATLAFPVLLRSGVDNGVSTGAVGGDLGGLGGLCSPWSAADYLVQRWQTRGRRPRRARRCCTTCGCGSSPTCSGSGWTTTSGRWPAGS